MNGTVTAAGMESADSGSENDYFERHRRALACLERSKACCANRKTHETEEAIRLIDEAIAQLFPEVPPTG